jgi:predicted AAA+ superfamily ATPase
MIRRDLETRLREMSRAFPAVTLTGPRQSGKSTLCRAVFDDYAYANLEAPDVREFAMSDPRGFLARFRGAQGAIIDEAQRVPELLSYLQPVIDDDPEPGRWILTGSQNFALLASIGQSLAGRAAVLHLLPCSFDEVRRFAHAPRTVDEALLAGGYPRIHDRGIPPSDWLASYVATYVERDVRTISNVGDLVSFQRFLELCAGRTGQVLNYSSLASDAGVSQPTAKSWLSILEASFIVFRLPAWSGNLTKRLSKAPKLHFYDSGLVCWLLGIRDVKHLRAHPLRGAIFESWVVSEALKARTNRGERAGLSHYRDQSGLEADLLVEDAGRVTVVEVKASATPKGDLARTAFRVRTTLGDRATETPVVVYAGDDVQERADVLLLPWTEAGRVAPRPPS